MNVPRLDESAEWTGHWWLPSDPERVVPGILRYEPHEGLRLSLIGGFENRILRQQGDNRVSVAEDSQTWEMILGVAENKVVTLLDCIPLSATSYRFGLHGLHRQTICSETALIGVHLSTSNATAFTRCHASIENFTMWSVESVFSKEIKFENCRRTGEASISATPREDSTVFVDGTAITLARSHTFPHFEQRRGQNVGVMRETAFLKFKPQEAWSLTTARDQVYVLRDLVSLATRRAAAVLWMTLYMPPEDREYPAGYPVHDREIAVYTKQILAGDSDAKTVKRREALFTCADRSFVEIVPRWLEVHEQCEAAANMVLGLHYAPDGFIETQLLTALGAAEAMHRALGIDHPPIPQEEFKRLRRELLEYVPEDHQDWFKQVFARNEPTLRERLMVLAELPDATAMEKLLPDGRTWARVAVQARNDLAHTGRTRRQSFDELIAVVKVSSAVVVLNLLQQLGVSGERQREIMTNNSELRYAAKLSSAWLTVPKANRGDGT